MTAAAARHISFENESNGEILARSTDISPGKNVEMERGD